jgi:hypothetical protein
VKDLSNFSPGERVESLKAGSLAGLSCLLAFGAIALVNTLILAQRWDALASLQVRAIDLNFGLRGLMALLGGFLFGVTYRYAIRQDVNPQLKSGVVLAFGLVRWMLDCFLNRGKCRVCRSCCRLRFAVSRVWYCLRSRVWCWIGRLRDR